MDPTHRRLGRRITYYAIYLLIALPWIIHGAVQALSTNANSPLDWVSGDYAPRRAYDRFSQLFGPADVVVISWPACTLDNPAIDTFVQSLRDAKEFGQNDQTFFDSITSGRDILQRLQSEATGVPSVELKQRLPRNVIGGDLNSTAVVIALNAEGLKRREVLIPLIRLAAVRYGGAAEEELHLAGPAVDGYEVDIASKAAVRRLAPVTLLISFLICYLFLDSLYAASVVFTTALLSQAAALAIIYYSGGTMSALMIVVPPLLQILAIAGGIHLVNYYYAELANASPLPSVDKSYPLARALRVAWIPCTLSSLTTAVGIGSLATSQLEAVRDFGLYCAAGVLLTLVMQLTIIPGCFWLWPVRFDSSNRFTEQRWERLYHFVRKRRGWLAAVGLSTACLLGFGVVRLQPSVRIETLFESDSRLLSDYKWIETNVGPLVPIEAVISLPQPQPLTQSEACELLAGIENELSALPRIASVFNAANLLPHPFSTQGSSADSSLLPPRGFAEEESNRLLSSLNYLQASEGKLNYRITAFTSALNEANYSEILRNIQSAADTYVHAWEREHRPTAGKRMVTIELCGLMPLVHEIQTQLLEDLYRSFLLAFGMIAIVMTIVLASVRAAIISMIPNVFPGVTLFGLLGWIGQPLDIGSIMTASVAMGIAVDDTLHFLSYFQLQLTKGESRDSAVLSAYRHCGRAMLQTTLICACGLAAFSFSAFVPTARFAWMMVVLMLAALLGDLVLLPALLMSPLGKYFQFRKEEQH